MLLCTYTIHEKVRVANQHIYSGCMWHCKISNQVRVIIYSNFADARLHIITTSSKKNEIPPTQNQHWQPNVVYSPFLFTRRCRQLNLSLGCRLHQWYKPTIAISYRKKHRMSFRHTWCLTRYKCILSAEGPLNDWLLHWQTVTGPTTNLLSKPKDAKDMFSHLLYIYIHVYIVYIETTCCKKMLL